MTKEKEKEYKIGEGYFLSEISLKDGEDGKFELPKIIQLARTGQFFRLFSDGEIWRDIKLTEEMFNSFIKNFKDKVTGIDLAIDFSHYAGEKAGAWFKDLVKIPSSEFPGEFDLKCAPRWTKSGIDSVGGGDFRYLSINFHEDYRDNQKLDFHGPTLLGAGFTNRPFIRNMNPTSKLSDESEKEQEEMEKKELEVKLSETNVELSEMKGKLSDSEKTLSEVQESNKVLKEENEKLSSEKKNSEKNLAFDKQLSENKVCEAQREHFLSGDMDKFLETAQGPLNLSEKGESQSDSEDGDDDDKVLAEANKLCEADKELSMSDAILKVKNK